LRCGGWKREAAWDQSKQGVSYCVISWRRKFGHEANETGWSNHLQGCFIVS
jgi:hypothetical protein